MKKLKESPVSKHTMLRIQRGIERFGDPKLGTVKVDGIDYLWHSEPCQPPLHKRFVHARGGKPK